jgi:predicted ATP-binding protein involved in virulence
MLGDLARRMAIANPQNSDPLRGNGVIIIDEIDLHLHP